MRSSISGRLEYTINIIDTPGFGDTRGLDHEKIKNRFALVLHLHCSVLLFAPVQPNYPFWDNFH
jgi:hypothetical protein